MDELERIQRDKLITRTEELKNLRKNTVPTKDAIITVSLFGTFLFLFFSLGSKLTGNLPGAWQFLLIPAGLFTLPAIFVKPLQRSLWRRDLRVIGELEEELRALRLESGDSRRDALERELNHLMLTASQTSARIEEVQRELMALNGPDPYRSLLPGKK